MKKTLSILFMLSLVLVICFGTVQANAQVMIGYCWEVCVDIYACMPTAQCYCGGGHVDPYDPYDLRLSTCGGWCNGDCEWQ